MTAPPYTTCSSPYEKRGELEEAKAIAKRMAEAVDQNNHAGAALFVARRGGERAASPTGMHEVDQVGGVHCPGVQTAWPYRPYDVLPPLSADGDRSATPPRLRLPGKTLGERRAIDRLQT